ncbi:MAG: [protein-PII] uridylyltransferase [Candidatus Magnetoovum sp. WYHC-5]|nr:[protein-PII] uridylyltransferase [Candidatus Magnetoovum sp. WYHC-5]
MLKDKLNAMLSSNVPGRNIAYYISRHMDKQIVKALPADFNKSEFAIYAIGGYGRKEMSPYSDVDIMLLAKDRLDTSYMEKVYYSLIDSGLEISHSFRTIDECIHEAKKDVKTRTSMLDSRFIAGSTALDALFQKQVYPALSYHKKGSQALFREMMEELKNRYKKYGSSPFLLEPDLKYSKGGLRDVHDALWVARVFLNVIEFEQLHSLISAESFKSLCKAHDFILSMRIALHIVTGRDNNALSFEHQEGVARLLGIRASRKFQASERLLRRYYIRARAVADINDYIRSTAAKGFINIKSNFAVFKINNIFSISRNKLMINNLAFIKKDPVQILEAYLLYAKKGKVFTRFLREHISKNLLLIDKAFRSDKRAVRVFLEILQSERVYLTLKMMQKDGVLDRFIPEFGALRFLVVHEPYHIYTVDEHTLLTIKALEALSRPYNNTEGAGFANIFRNFKDKYLLYLSLLFHDIGKSQGRLHTTAGYKALFTIFERLQLEHSKRATVEFLVQNHILIYGIALNKDTEDYETIAQFIDTVNDEYLLDALLLVTYGDMCAVNPEFLTSWKRNLLLSLYNISKKYIKGIKETPNEYIQTLISKSTNSSEGFQAFLKFMPERYFLTSTIHDIGYDFTLFTEYKEKGFSFGVKKKRDNTDEITIIAADRPGLLSDILGVFSLRRLNIISLRTFNSTEGFIVDRVVVSNYRQMWWEGMDELLKEETADIIQGRREIRLPQRKYIINSRFSPFINMDNESSAFYILIETFSQDRIGLLRDITGVFSNEGFNIAMARVNTESDVAMDVFYINKTIDNSSLLKLVRVIAELWEVLQ